MNKTLLVFFTCLLPFCSYAQYQDYQKKAEYYYTTGNYTESITQYDAALVMMKNAKIKTSSPEYLNMEKARRKAEQCESLKNSANRLFNAAKNQANFENARKAYQNLLTANASDVNAKNRVKECGTMIDQLAQEEKDRTYWENSLASNTIESYQAYLDAFSEGLYASAALNSIQSLQDEKLKLDDERLWSISLKENTRSSYNNYITLSKTGNHVADANKKITDIAEENERKQAALNANTIGSSQGYAEVVNHQVSVNNDKITQPTSNVSAYKAKSSGWDGRVLLGLGIEGELFGYSGAYSPLVHLKIGKCDDLFNFSTGVQYTRLEALDKDHYDASISIDQINVPVFMRFNMGEKVFFSFGGSYNYNMKAAYHDRNDAETLKSNSLINKTNFSGEVRLGIMGESYDLSIYYKRDITSPYAEDYINSFNESDYVRGQLDEKGRIGASFIFYINLSK